MPVIPSQQRHRSEEPAPARPRNREARIHGIFRSAGGGLGTMTGEPVDSTGTTIGVDRRHLTVPAEIALSLHDLAVVIEPVDVDLRTKLQEMGPCMVALRKTALPQPGSTECVESVVDAVIA
jgi:hypothetical protein